MGLNDRLNNTGEYDRTRFIVNPKLKDILLNSERRKRYTNYLGDNLHNT